MKNICLRKINEHGKWKHIPISVGGAAPKRNDLIEFEELVDYNTEIATERTNSDQKVNKKQTAQKRKEKRKKLLKELVIGQQETTSMMGDVSKDDCAKDVSISHATRKRRLREKKMNTKKRKLSQQQPVTCNDDEEVSRRKKISENEFDPEVMKEWNGLNVPLPVMKALFQCRFHSPMPIQKQVLHAAILEKRDILGAAETGSGKTLAFGIPLLHHLLKDKVGKENACNSPKFDRNQFIDEDFDESDMCALIDGRDCDNYLPALVLTPTRELALQVSKHLKNAAKYTTLHIVSVVGGLASQKQMRLLKKMPDIVVATPGRLWEVMGEDIPCLSQIHRLRYLVVDEADRMLEAGHFEDLTKILDAIHVKGVTKKRQTFIFSATLTTTHTAPHRWRKNKSSQLLTKEVKLSKLMKKIGMRKKPHIVDLTTDRLVADKLREGKIICEYTSKDFYLYYFLKSFPGRTVVFANSIDCIFRLSALFELLQCHPLHIHAKMQQRQRLKHLDRFQEQEDGVMFASDVAARGLDIPDVRHVIHYQVPRTMESYIHRSGRCARSGKEGYTLLLISPQEMPLYKRLCRNLQKDDGIADLVVEQSYIGAVTKRVRLARDIDALVHQQKKVKLSNQWFKQAAVAIDMELDNELIMQNSDALKKEVAIETKRKLLSSLLATPIFPKGYSGKFITKEGQLALPGLDQKPEKRKRK